MSCVDTTEEQQLQAELDTVKRVSRAKDQQISELEEKLEVECKRMVFLATQELETNQQKGKARVSNTFSADK